MLSRKRSGASNTRMNLLWCAVYCRIFDTRASIVSTLPGRGRVSVAVAVVEVVIVVVAAAVGSWVNVAFRTAFAVRSSRWRVVMHSWQEMME